MNPKNNFDVIMAPSNIKKQYNYEIPTLYFVFYIISIFSLIMCFIKYRNQIPYSISSVQVSLITFLLIVLGALSHATYYLFFYKPYPIVEN